MSEKDGLKSEPELQTSVTPPYLRIDHIAIAVKDLESAITFYTEALGFTLRRRLQVRGKKTGMLSAELDSGPIRFVLCQGTEPESQVSKLVDLHGPCVAHVALSVDDVRTSVSSLKAKGVTFDTNVIEGPGLQQCFTSRDKNSGLSIELIARGEESGFLEANVQSLFDQLEQSGSY